MDNEMTNKDIRKLYSAILNQLIIDSNSPEYREEVEYLLGEGHLQLFNLASLADIDYKSLVDKLNKNLNR